MSDRKEWQPSYQPMNYNGYDSYGSNSQFIGQYYEQVLSQQADGQTLNPNLDSQSQEENSHVVASRPPIPPTPLEESEVSREYENEKEMGETTLGSNVQVDRPIESLTLVEEKESTQGDETQKMVTDENCNHLRV
ncbi:hypothetical protein L3X38_039690 [Prunus dulcis]|uniref:Uncharacterized protein n=1 Tax=Prunus dulcis TaxID=3755 RepID=A0AAD4V9R7_PRUDU|nr:hypothetical protein L3X38_039690 [Prunus dulcis]